VSFRRRGDARVRLNVVLPNFYKDFAFGGITSAMELCREISRHYEDVRFVSLAPLGEDQEMFDFSRFAARPARTRLSRHSMAAGPLPCHQREVFLCTWWKTVLVWEALAAAMREAGLDPNPFYYFIQDYEPGFYPYGSPYAQCLRTYAHADLAHGVFNSSELATFFTRRGHKFARRYVIKPSLNPSILAWLKEHEFQLPPRDTERDVILCYGRPTQARNCFPALMEGLYRFFESMDPQERRRFVVFSAGLDHEDVILCPEVTVASLGKLPIKRYVALLAQAHVGVSLMASPHPSYPPLEMATCGAYTITNDFANKRLSKAHPLLHCLEHPVAEELVPALAQGVAWARANAGKPATSQLPANMSRLSWQQNVKRADIQAIVPGR
jgi:hypothetical protein